MRRQTLLGFALAAILLVIVVVLLVWQTQMLNQTRGELAAARTTATAQTDSIRAQATSGAETLALAATRAADEQAQALSGAATQAAQEQEQALSQAATQAAGEQAEALALAATHAAATQAAAVNAAQDAAATAQAQLGATQSALVESQATQQASIAELESALEGAAATATHEAIRLDGAKATLEAQAETIQALEDQLVALQPELDPAIAFYAAIPQSRTDDGAFVLGDPEAPVTLIVFADIMCPHCWDYKETVDRFIREYVIPGEARLEYRMFITIDPVYSMYTGLLIECADTLQAGMFWPAQEILYELAPKGDIDFTVTTVLAERLGLDSRALEDCTFTAQQVFADSEFGHEVGVRGTPAVLIRYGDEDPRFITRAGITYNHGGVPYDVLVWAIERGGGSQT